MNEEARAARLAYMRKWRADNREHVRDYRRSYRAANKQKFAEQQSRYWARKAEAMEQEKEPNQ